MRDFQIEGFLPHPEMCLVPIEMDPHANGNPCEPCRQTGQGILIHHAEYGFCRDYLYPWLAKFRDQGWEALAEQIAQGPAPKLNEKQHQQVKRWIIGKDPRQYGFDFGLWSRGIVQALIEQKLGSRWA